MTQLMEVNEINAQLQDKLVKADKNIEKVKRQRNDFKTAWENTDNLLQKQTQDAKILKY